MTSEEIDELAMRSYAADGVQTNPMDWGRAFRAGIAALQQRQAEQAAAEFEAWDHRYERSRLDCGPTAKALQMTIRKPAAAWQAAAQAAESREAARAAEFRRRLDELFIQRHMQGATATIGLRHGVLCCRKVFDEIFAATSAASLGERPGSDDGE